MVVTVIAPDGGRWRRSETSPSTANTDGMAPWEKLISQASSSRWTLRGSWTCGACASTIGPFST